MPPAPSKRRRRRFQNGFFGFINASKGVDVLLRAAARLKKSGLPVRVLFVGDSLGSSDSTNEATTAAVTALVASLGLRESVITTGHLSAGDVSATLALADLVVLPYTNGASLNRGSLLACLAQGLPVVTTPPRAQPEVPARHRVAPFDDPLRFHIDERVVAFTPAGDDDALAACIRDLAGDPQRRAARGTAAQAFVAPLQWPAIAEATSTLYQRVRNAAG